VTTCRCIRSASLMGSFTLFLLAQNIGYMSGDVAMDSLSNHGKSPRRVVARSRQITSRLVELAS